MSPFGNYPLEHMLYSARLMGHPQASSPAALYLMQHHLADPRQQWPAHFQMWPPGIGLQQPPHSWCGRSCPPTVHGAYPHMPTGMLQPYHFQSRRQPHPPPGDPPRQPQQDQASRGSQREHAESSSRHQDEPAVTDDSSSSSSTSSGRKHSLTPHVSQLRASAPSFPNPVSAAASSHPSQSPAACYPLPEAPQVYHNLSAAAVTHGPQIRAAQQRALKKKPKLQKALTEVPADAAAASLSTTASSAASHGSLAGQAAYGKPSPAAAGSTPHAPGRHSDDAAPQGHGDGSESENSEAADLAEAVSRDLLPLRKGQCSIKAPSLDPLIG